MVTAGPETVMIDERSEGQRGVIRALLDEAPGTAAEIAKREGVSIGEKQTRDWLKRLRSEGYVSRDDSQPYTWAADGLADAPHTARVRLPDLE
jgi:predicted ArsR family transcriptional regulator